MSDSFRTVGSDSRSYVADDCVRKLKIAPKPTATYEVEGKRDDLLAGKPALGDVFETILGADFVVIGVDIDDLGEGDGAEMTISTECTLPEETGELTPIGDPTYSVQFAEIHRVITQHPCMGKLTGAARLANKSLDEWWNLTESDWIPRGSSGDFPEPIGLWGSLIGHWTFDDYIFIRESGIEDFVLYSPTITRTLNYTGRPDGVGDESGTISYPPTGIFNHVSSYDWLQGPDEVTRRGKTYERTTSWIGASWVNSRVYFAT